MLDKTEFHRDLNINQILTESDTNKPNARFQLKRQIQRQELKDSGWRFDMINSMTIYFIKLVK